jgi:membrane-associated phospholipid phosphatase
MNGWLYPYERRLLWIRRGQSAAAILAILVLAFTLDGCAYPRLYVGYLDKARLESRDWYRTFRVAGSLYPWLLIATAIALAGLASGRTRASAAGSRAGVMIFLAAAFSGLVAEIGQVIFGRLRPDAALEQGRHFKGLLERFRDSGALGFPSSHTAVAFGAAVAVGRFWPGAGWVALAAAAGCGLTRLLAGAHYISDVYAGAVVGYACARSLLPRPCRGLLLP